MAHAEAALLLETHLNDLPERQEFSGRSIDVDVEERDINKNPPDRAFLEQHIDAERFLDFVSTRSPVFKQRPLPRSKKEAIDLMMEQPNLIKRPILIRGAKVTFGFDKAAYAKRLDERGPRSARRAGAIPAAKGPGTASSIRDQAARKKRGRKFDELAFYAEHFDTVEINSTFYRVPTPATARGWAERTPADFEFSLKLFQKFTHPDMFEKATGADPFDLGQKDVDEFRAGLDPLASAGKLGALLAQFPASFKNEPDSRGYLEWLLEAFKDYPVAVELRHRTWSDDPADTLQLLAALGAAWAQIDEPKFRLSIRQSLLPNVQDLLLPAPARPQRRAVVEPRQLGGSLQLSLLGRGAGAVCRGGGSGVARGQEGLRLRQQPLLGEVGRQRRDPQAPARPAAAGRVPRGVRRALSGPEGPRQAAAAAAHSRTEAFLSTSALLDLRGDVHAR